MDEHFVKDIRDLAAQIANPQTGENVHYVAVPSNVQVVSLEKFQYPFGVPPARVRNDIHLQETASLCSYINAYKDHRTRIFASADDLSFTAIIDYHGVGDSETVKPEFLSHRAILDLDHSPEWMTWLSQNNQLIPQADFVEFLEDNRTAIISPDSATMLEITRDLSAHTEANFKSKVNLQNGTVGLAFEETIKTTVAGNIEMPDTFTLSLPVFFGESRISIDARLRFRINNGKLSFQYKLNQPKQLVADAFQAVRRGIEAATTLEVLLGKVR